MNADEIRPGEVFHVYQFFPDGGYERAGEFLPIETAMQMAKRLTESVGGRIGTTRSVMITDMGDCCVFEWKHGEGVVFPAKTGEPA